MTAFDLAGAGVLVTRPVDRAESLAKLIRNMGGVPTSFPGIRIEPVERAVLKSILQGLAGIDLVIFVSPTAVQLGIPAIIESFGTIDRLRVAAVGKSTAAELRKFGLRNIIVPREPGGSEALADCSQLSQVADRSVLLVRGEGGNDMLASILEDRGARVSFLECYRRRLPDANFSAIEPMLRDGRIAAWIATSGEILDNLFRLSGDHGDLLRSIPLFVNHPHVARRGFSQAVKVIFVTTGGDKGIAAGISLWFCRLRTSRS